MKGLWHVVLFTFHANASEVQKTEVLERLKILGDDCGGKNAGIIMWKAGENLDLRKNIALVEIATFRNNEALQRFRAHPKHAEFVAIVRECADWQVGDIY